MADVAQQTLHVVAKELGLTLGEARQSLEAYAERPDDPAALAVCADRLHEVHGVLRVVEVYGAALLAEEMEQVARFLLDAEERPTAGASAEGLDALMRSMVQLPAYLERVLGGGRDLALVLLPLLNDLRAVRGQALLSEGTLLLLNLTSDRQPQPVPPQPGEPPLNVAQWARRLRPRYQVGLLGWIKGERAAQHLEILSAVAEHLEQVATRQPVFQLWWVVGSIVEALREGGLDGTQTVKRLLGQADRELKRLYETGEARYAEIPPLDLLNNLLYYVARATTNGPRVASVRASFKLQELLPVSEQVEQERESLSAPSVRLMQTVAAAIKEDLSRVKDVLDIFVRKGGAQVEELSTQLDMLRKIADTLGVLGLGHLRQKVQGQIARLQEVVARRAAPSDGVLVEVAATLIAVEDSLDSQLVRLIMPQAHGGPVPDAVEEDGDFRQVQEAALRECIVNLARIKETIAAIVGRRELTGADQVPQLLRGLTAGLLMLGRSRAVEIMEGIARHVEDVLRPNARLNPGRLDRLADAIVSIEYYMETLQSGRSDPWYMLDNAESCLRALGAPDALALPTDSAPASGDTGVYAKTLKLDPPAASAPAAGPALDPELVTLFVEEAREELAKIERYLPMWDENPLDQDSLVRVRRSFHTLKGSGRMVGARVVGEFAWSIENLLNRVISGTLARGPALLDLLRAAVATLPQLVDELESGRTPSAAVGLLIGRAQALAEGRDPAQAQAVDVAPQEAVAARKVPDAPATVAAPPPSTSEETSLIATEDLLSSDPALPKPVPPAAADGASPVLEPPTRFVRVVDQPRPDEDERRRSANPPPPPPSGSEFVMNRPELGAPAGSDPVLIDIYRKEVGSHVAAVRAWLAECDGRFPPFPVNEQLHRACHTLAGASKMAEAEAGIRVAEPLNLYVRKLHDHGLGLSEAGKRVLADAMVAMDEIVARIEDPEARFPAHDELLTRLAWLDGDANREIQRRGLRPIDPAEQSGPLPLPGVDLIDVDAMLEAPPPAPAAPAPALAPAASVAAPPAEAEPYDPEIAMIFSEEATELLELADAALAAYRDDAADEGRITELKRVLHTLKGGARMAGVTAMGDLAHELESLLIQTETARTTSEPRTLDVLQASLDELHRMRETVAAGRPVVPARDLITRIRSLYRPAGPPVLRTVAPEQPLPTPAAAPAPAPATPTPAPPAVELPVVKDIAATGRFRQPPEAPPVADESPVTGTPAAPTPPADDALAMRAPDEGPDQPEAVLDLDLSDTALDFDLTAAAEEAPVAAAFAHAAEPPVEPPAAEPAAAALAAEAPTYDDTACTSMPPTRVPPVADEAPEPAVVGAPEQSRSFVLPPGREPPPAPERQELARVDAELLDSLLNSAGEVSIFRARLEQQLSSVEFNLSELSRVVQRLKDQLRNLELQTEAQILHKHGESRRREDFDPLELDQYSALQQYSRALAESTSDVASVQGLLDSLTREAQNLLMQQARVVTDLQNGLMRTRMVPFSRHVQRLTRIVRQVANETGKQVELNVSGASGELDRQVLERMLPPFEHMLRNAVVHGIEAPAERVARGKAPGGRIDVQLKREGAEVVIVVADDGNGIDVRAIRAKAVSLGMLEPKQTLSDEEAMQLILEPGFSTAQTISQAAGRGVGMDVVATEIKKLGGALHMETTQGKGTRFTIRLPFTLAISQALIVRTGDEMYALPLPTVEGVVRLPKADVLKHLAQETATYEYGGQRYRFQHLGLFVGGQPSQLPEQEVPVPVVLIRAGESSTALVADELVGSREIVVKSVGPQIAGIRGISGATILGDGRIVVILDMGSLVRTDWRLRPAPPDAARERADRRTFALVVDDSITVRRVTQRLLERNGMRVMTAKDGVDAVAILQEHVPDVILLDIEMPRMDGYELAAHVRGEPRLKHVPIVMITSRQGEKHRARAIELGVDDYLGKPYQENQLLDAIEPLVNARRDRVPEAI
ncbi:MAG: Hpt domain-containing protein [Steroidobacteraceae bacterium]|jgi:chemosensory pili system protein ChpA (sensor histidine kinase/response regulator)|nr:Hpt domain-containing protein [Steroidobacteraceae bacterium]